MLLIVTLKSSPVCVPTTRTVNPWMIPFLSSGGGEAQVTSTDVALIAVTLTLIGASLGSVQNKKIHYGMHGVSIAENIYTLFGYPGKHSMAIISPPLEGLGIISSLKGLCN